MYMSKYNWEWSNPFFKIRFKTKIGSVLLDVIFKIVYYYNIILNWYIAYVSL